MEPKLRCRGSVCDRSDACVMAGGCQYKSSAEQAIEVISAQKTGDFTGKIDGGGVKQVMKEPKTMVDLIDPQFIEGIGEVLKFGAKKYAKNNWMRGMSWSTALGGVLRHVLAFLRGEEFDLETGLPHLHHAACGLMFVCYFAHGPKNAEHRAFDDRGYLA